MKTRLALVASASTALACSLAGIASAQAAVTATSPVVYHAGSSGKTVIVTQGTTFKISLEACGDCGDSWSFSHRPASSIVKVTGHKTVSEAKPPAVGGQDHQIWTFKARHNGTTTIRLVERSAEKSNKVIKHYSLTVKVPETLVVD